MLSVSNELKLIRAWILAGAPRANGAFVNCCFNKIAVLAAAPALATAVACGSPESLSPISGAELVAELAPALDTNPDPHIVEVSLIASPASIDYLPGKPASVWAYRDGSAPGAPARVPGPLIEAKKGDLVIVHFKNELPEYGTTVHFHGVRLPFEMDGAHHVVFPGETFDYVFEAKDAATFWYHPHVRADQQIERGLQGVLYVREGPAPRRAGDRILVLDDVKLTESGELAGAWDDLDIENGRQGDVLLVNGAPEPALRTTSGSRERWHLVNSSNGRFFNLELEGHSFEVIGWDGGLIEAPYETDTLLVAPGERYDVLVNIEASPGERLELRTLPYDNGHSAGGEAPRSLFRLDVDEGPPTDATPPAAGPVPRLPVGDATPSRVFELTDDLHGEYGPQFFINGEAWPFNNPIKATLGDLEVWEIRNESAGHHPFHVHGMFFQVLSVDDAVEDRIGWKDTALAPAMSTLRFAVRYDAPGFWMFHCQIPEHAERGMMGELSVTPTE